MADIGDMEPDGLDPSGIDPVGIDPEGDGSIVATVAAPSIVTAVFKLEETVKANF